MQSVPGQGQHCGISMSWEQQAVQQQEGLGKGQGAWQGHSSMGQL